MSDKVVKFPERRESIPVNLPDIKCLKAIPCLMCENRSFALMGSVEAGIVEVACCNCNARLPLANATFLTLPTEGPA